MDTVMDNAYGGLVADDVDGRWAFGGSFADPLAGVDTAVPSSLDARAVAAYCLSLGDDALVLAQRLQQWCTRAPELEEEVALANIALDLLGQTRLLYARAAAADPGCVPVPAPGSPVPGEDRLAFFRSAEEYRCVRLVQLPDEDFADLVVRLTVFSCWRHEVLQRLTGSSDPVLAAVAARALAEVRYHRDWSARWLVVLADGTEESRRRTRRALGSVWPWTAELGTVPVPQSLVAAGVAAAPGEAWTGARRLLTGLLGTVDLEPVDPAAAPVDGGWLVPLLAEMQQVARDHPAGRW